MTDPHTEDLPVEYTDLVPVFYGSHAEVVTLRSALDAHGFTTFVPAENMKVMDPFAIGGSVFTLSLVAPAGQAEEVLALIAELRPPDPEGRMSTPRERRRWWLLALLIDVPTFFVLVLVRLIIRGVRALTGGPDETPPGADAAPESSPGG